MMSSKERDSCCTIIQDQYTNINTDAVIRASRLVTEECIKWSNQRLVFGKKLIEQPVIRQK